jgi:hypothetical protein
MYELAILGAAAVVFFMDYKAIGAQFRDLDIQTMGARILYQYSKANVKWQKYWSTTSQKYWVVGFAISSVQYIQRFAYSKLANVRIEPFSRQWMSTCVLSRDLSKINVLVTDKDERQVNYGCYFYENYISNGEWPRDRAQSFYESECNVRGIFASIEDIEILMLMKSGGLYLSRVIYLLGHDDSSLDLHPLWSPSSVRFLSVEYHHPSIDNPVPIEIDRGFYLEGNHLLSAAFVKRCLEYHSKDCLFDMNYTLKIMDGNINTIELKSDEYVVLDSDNYKIITV